MIRAWNKTSKIYQRFQSFYLPVYSCLIYRQYGFIHISYASDIFSEFLSHRRKAILPRAVFDWKHNIHTAIQRNQISPICSLKFCNHLVVRAHPFSKYIRINQRAVFITNIFPETAKVKFYSRLKNSFNHLRV